MTDSTRPGLEECRRAHGLVQEIYASPMGGAGCCWHAVLDDGNLDTQHIELSIKYATEHGHAACIAIGPIVLRMSKTQRLKLRSGGYKNT